MYLAKVIWSTLRNLGAFARTWHTSDLSFGSSSTHRLTLYFECEEHAVDPGNMLISIKSRGRNQFVMIQETTLFDCLYENL